MELCMASTMAPLFSRAFLLSTRPQMALALSSWHRPFNLGYEVSTACKRNRDLFSVYSSGTGSRSEDQQRQDRVGALDAGACIVVGTCHRMMKTKHPAKNTRDEGVYSALISYLAPGSVTAREDSMSGSTIASTARHLGRYMNRGGCPPSLDRRL